jgi:hypothetical protein
MQQSYNRPFSTIAATKNLGVRRLAAAFVEA